MTYNKHTDCTALSQDTIKLLEHAAMTAATRAHCPYSKFHVGAAVLCEGGSIITGCNIENASFGLTVCAERTALFSTISQARKPIAMAVVCPDAGADAPAHYRMPCGACRQVMAEFLSDDAPIVVGGVNVFALRELLPASFKL